MFKNLIKPQIFALLTLLLVGLYFAVSPKQTAASTSGQIYKQCKDKSLDCYQSELTKIAKSRGVKYVIETLKLLHTQAPVTRSCHAMSHKISWEAVPDKFDWKTLTEGIDPNICSGGFIHGMLEGAASQDANFELNEESFSKICNSYQDEYNQGSCIHVLGHFLMVESEGKLNKPVEICNNLKLTNSSECFAGVFMEHFSQQNLILHGLVQTKPTWDQDFAQKMAELCNTYPNQSGKSCWEQMGPLLGFIYDKNPQVVYNDCQKAPTPEHAAGCYRSAAIMIVLNTDNTDYINTVCDPYKSVKEREKCAQNSVTNLLRESSQNLSKARDFCNHSEAVDRNYCLGLINEN